MKSNGNSEGSFICPVTKLKIKGATLNNLARASAVTFCEGAEPTGLGCTAWCIVSRQTLYDLGTGPIFISESGC